MPDLFVAAQRRRPRPIEPPMSPSPMIVTRCMLLLPCPARHVAAFVGPALVGPLRLVWFGVDLAHPAFLVLLRPKAEPRSLVRWRFFIEELERSGWGERPNRRVVGRRLGPKVDALPGGDNLGASARNPFDSGVGVGSVGAVGSGATVRSACSAGAIAGWSLLWLTGAAGALLLATWVEAAGAIGTRSLSHGVKLA